MEHFLEQLAEIDSLIALAVVAATGVTDAVYVFYTSAVVARDDFGAANWGALTYLLSGVAVVSFANNWAYVVFAGIGSWIGGYLTMKFLRWRGDHKAEAEPAAAPPNAGALAEAPDDPGPDLSSQPNRRAA
jgi:hypothetical protein